MAENKKIILLFGPKGSGKSHIGRIAEKHFDVKFFYVESIWLQMQKEFTDHTSQIYLQEGLKRTLHAIKEALVSRDTLVMETTGAFAQFDEYLLELKQMAEVVIVEVIASTAACFDGMNTRDPAAHVILSETVIADMDQRTRSLKIPTNTSILNDPRANETEIIEILSKYLP